MELWEVKIGMIVATMKLSNKTTALTGDVGVVKRLMRNSLDETLVVVELDIQDSQHKALHPSLLLEYNKEVHNRIKTIRW